MPTTLEPVNFEKISCSVPLSREEVEEKAQQAAVLKLGIENLEFEKKAFNDGVNGSIKGKTSELSQLLADVRNKTEFKTIEAEVKQDYDKGRIEWTYRGKVVQTRQMEVDDRQMKIL